MKKVISLLLAVVLLVTFITPVMASGSVSADKGLENAIKAVKEKIDIPADCKNFTYNIYSQNGTATWNLVWSNEETPKYINVTIDGDNFITNYSSYDYSSNYNDKKIPKYSKDQGKEIAEKFVNNINPGLLSQYKQVENNDAVQDREYYFNYVRQVNGISYNTDTISVNVNSYTGQVSNYNCNYSKNVSFEDASKLISPEDAQKAFKDKLGLKLVYNYKTLDGNKTTSYLAYVPKYPNKYIDAITGEVEDMPNRYGILYDKSDSTAAKAAVERAAGLTVTLTPEEEEAIKGISGLLTKEQVDAKLRGVSQLNIDTDFKLSNSQLQKDWRNEDSFIWSFQYSKIINKDTNLTRDISVSVDAKTGDILDFWTYYSSPEGTKPQKTKEQAKAISDDVLQKLIPGYYSKVKYDDTYTAYDDGTQNQFGFRYVRIQNGLECPSDTITISFDNLSGNVVGINTSWIKSMKFDDPTQVIPVEKAYDVLFSKIGFGVEYASDYANNKPVPLDKVVDPQTTVTNAVLGYFINSRVPNTISATTGDVLNYSGLTYKENNLSDYTDIEGLAAADKVKILTQLSIRYNENELKPDEALLQKDYFLLLCKLNDIYYFDPSVNEDTAVERMYTNLISSGIITKAEKAPNATITREEAAKYFVKFLRLSQVAELKGIFKSDFKDADKIDPNLLGYVCIASGMKVMNGSNGYFNPKNKITRLEGLLTIYGYLDNK